MTLSSNRTGHRPFTAAMPGSNPAGVTTSEFPPHGSGIANASRLRVPSAVLRASSFSPPDPLRWAPAGTPSGRVAQMVSAPACHAGGRGFDPRHGRQRPLRLIGQDASLSSWKRGFKSRRGHQYGSVLKW